MMKRCHDQKMNQSPVEQQVPADGQLVTQVCVARRESDKVAMMSAKRQDPETAQ
jgi:hypothetical protein